MKRYMAVLSDLSRQIAEGQLRPGQKLPSVRQAAELYGCSISTIIRAYAELEKRHEIYSISQSGFYVVDTAGSQQSRQEGEPIDLASASPDALLFPYLDFQHCLNKAIDTYKYQLFTYGHALGMEKLRHTLVSHLANDQVFAKPEQIVITSGAQQALEMLARIPFPNGNSVILVEQPSYDLYLRFLEKEGLPVSGIARSAAGIDLQQLEARFKSGTIKFFYTMPRFHNPLGTSYSLHERKTIARLAEKYNVYVVEDDYMADLGGEQKADPVYAYSRSHVVYVKSFSKVIFPGLRLGAAVFPETLMKTIQMHKTYPDASLLSQAALDVYIKNGMYERHRHTIQSQYVMRLQALDEAAARYNQSGVIEVSGGHSGVYAQFKLPQTINLERLTKRLAARKVHVVSSKAFYLADYLALDKFLRISVSRAQPEQIAEGVKAIIEEAGRVMIESR